MLACRAGDQNAWELLLRRYQRLIDTIPRRLGLNQEMAADVFQLVCLRLLEHLQCIEQPERIGAWLATTTQRESRRLLYRERMLVPVGDDGEGEEVIQLADPAPLPDEVLERLEDQHAVRRALASLDPRCNCLLSLLYYHHDQPSYADIAVRLDLPVGSIGPTRARCLKKLQRALEVLGH